MKIYIAGKITNHPDFIRDFGEAEKQLKEQGHMVMNPSILPEGFAQNEYMHICYSMIDTCEAVYMLSNWTTSKGARLELQYAMEKGKRIIFQSADNKCSGCFGYKDGKCKRVNKEGQIGICWMEKSEGEY